MPADDPASRPLLQHVGLVVHPVCRRAWLASAPEVSVTVRGAVARVVGSQFPGASLCHDSTQPTAPGRLSEDRINRIVQAAVQRAGIDPDQTGYSAHSLRAGFATYAAARGISDRAIQNQTRHKHPSTVHIYTRHESVWTDNAATELGL